MPAQPTAGGTASMRTFGHTLSGVTRYAGGKTEVDYLRWEDLVNRQHHRWTVHRDNAASRSNSTFAASRRADDRLHRIETAFHACLAELPEIQRTDPAAAAGLRKLEAARRRTLRRQATEEATAQRLTATWTVARGGKVPKEYRVGEQNTSFY